MSGITSRQIRLLHTTSIVDSLASLMCILTVPLLPRISTRAKPKYATLHQLTSQFDETLASNVQRYLLLLLSYTVTLLYSAIMSKSDHQRCAFERLIGCDNRTFSLAATVLC